MNPSATIVREGRAGRVTFNRLKGQQVLDLDIVTVIYAALINWMDDAGIEFVLFDHAELTQGFCGGYDLEKLLKLSRRRGREAQSFLGLYYRLCHLMASYPKPIVTVADGFTAGCGLALTQNARYQICTERSVFSFPETSFGFVPDSGATYYLPRMRGELGTWLALTGERIKGRDIVAAEMTTHFCASENLTSLKSELVSSGIGALNQYLISEEVSRLDTVLQRRRFEKIDFLFSGDDARMIYRRLSRGDDWAKSQAHKLRARSPLATKITLRQLRTGRIIDSLEVALKIEYRIAARLVQARDFSEGVRATLIDKDHCPRWTHRSFEKAHADEVGRFFSPLYSGELDLQHVRQGQLQLSA